jgi:hypothetical protein
MADKTLALIGTLFLSILIAASYFPLQSRLSQADFLSWTFGAMFVQVLPILLVTISVMFGLGGLYMISQRFS